MVWPSCAPGSWASSKSRRAQVDARHPGVGESRLGEIGAARARAPGSSAAVGEEELVEVGAGEPDAAQVGADEARAVEVGARHVGLVQVGTVELGETQIAVAQVERRLTRRHVLVDHQVGVGDDEVAVKETEQRALGARREGRHGVAEDLSSFPGLAHADGDGRLIDGLTGDGGDEEREAGHAGQQSSGQQQADGVMQARAQEGTEERRLQPPQEDADEHEERDVGEQRQPMHPRDGDVVIGQEGKLHVEEQDHRHDDDGQPRHAVQEHADDAAALGAGDGLREEEVVELQAQRVGALLGRLQHADRARELERLARQLHQLAHEPQVQQHEQDGREQEEAGELYFDLQDGQGDVAVEQQVLVGDPGHSDQQVADEGNVDQPRGVCQSLERLTASSRL